MVRRERQESIILAVPVLTLLLTGVTATSRRAQAGG